MILSLMYVSIDVASIPTLETPVVMITIEWLATTNSGTISMIQRQWHFQNGSAR